MVVKSGRKNVYKEDVKPRLEEITEWKRQGASIDEISKALGITRQTFHNHLNKHEELREALIMGKRKYEVDLRKSVYARAKGYMIKEKNVKNFYNCDGDLLKSIETINERYIYSDFLASKILRLDTVADDNDIPAELKEIMKITEQNMAEDEY